MKTLGILTPVLASPDTIELLPETIESVQSQTLPDGWDLEWLIVEDGKNPKLRDYNWPEDVRYRAIEKQVGEPSARTLALAMTVANHVLAFDADDTLPPNALYTICQAFDQHPEASWVAGQEATPRDHQPWIHKNDPSDRIEAGLCPPDTLYPFWLRSGQYPVTFQCTYKTEVLWRYGGYPAMPYAGDINLLFAVSTTDPGVVLHDTVLNYRRWPGQMTAEPAYFAVEDLSYEHIKRWAGRVRND